MLKSILKNHRNELIIAVLFFNAIAHAETIHLKSGKSVVGKITGRNAQFVEMDVDGVTSLYSMDLIDEINDEKAAQPSQPINQFMQENNKGEPQEEKQALYIDPTYHFEVQYPLEWQLRKYDKDLQFVPPDFKGINTNYDFVRIGVVHSSESPHPRSLDSLIDKVIANAKKDKEKFNLLERSTTQIDGKEALYIVFERAESDGLKKRKQYAFRDHGNLYVLIYSASKETFDKYLTEADSLIKSIKIK